MVRGSNFSRHQERKERFARYLKSGLTVAEFCEWEGVSTASFYNWRKKPAGDTPIPVGLQIGHAVRSGIRNLAGAEFIPSGSSNIMFCIGKVRTQC